MYQDGLLCPLTQKIMGETVEALASEFGISRAEQDEFAARSQQRCQEARQAGRFRAELAPLPALDHDEQARDGVSALRGPRASPGGEPREAPPVRRASAPHP